MEDVIYTNDAQTHNSSIMSQKMLFAVDTQLEETIVSDSPKGSNKINLVERIARRDNEILYQAVMTLTGITRSPNLDTALFNAMNKVCQMIYKKYKEGA